MVTKDTLKIYHNGKQNGLKKIRGLVDDQSFEILEINILKDKFTATRLLQLCNKMKVNLKDVVDTECEFYKNNFIGSSFDEADWVRILVEHPELITTPIVETSITAEIIENPREVLSVNH